MILYQFQTYIYFVWFFIQISLRFLLSGDGCGMDMSPGGRLNKKDDLTRYGDSHIKDKTS